MTTKISHIMNKKLETIEEMASVQQAAKKMKDKNVSSLVVVLTVIGYSFAYLHRLHFLASSFCIQSNY
jgi:hypothetical protein